MRRFNSNKVIQFMILCLLMTSFSFVLESDVYGQRARARRGRPSGRTPVRREGTRRRGITSGPVRANSATTPMSVEPFAALAREVAAGNSSNINFRPTNLDPKAEATGQVALRDQTILVRMRAKNMLPPNHFGVGRYSLWAYLPNYKQRVYIGDLPIKLTPNGRGVSDSAFRYTALPRGATFGGLILTAEPSRFTPVVNEPLRPVLVALNQGEAMESAAAAKMIYVEPQPAAVAATTKGQIAPKGNRQTNTRRKAVVRRRRRS